MAPDHVLTRPSRPPGSNAPGVVVPRDPRSLTVAWPPLATLLRTAELGPADWLAIGVAVLAPVVLLEAAKAWRRPAGAMA